MQIEVGETALGGLPVINDHQRRGAAICHEQKSMSKEHDTEHTRKHEEPRARGQ